MDSSSFSYILNALLGLVMYFMNLSHNNTKEALSAVRTDVETLKTTSLRKEDFREFKQELWQRLDRMENSINEKEKK